MLGKVVTAMALGATVVTAQLSNSSIFSILNTSQLSPSYKFAQYLQSSPDFQPVVDLLSQPGNLTVFIPSDEALDQAIQLANSTNSNSTTGHNTTSGAHNSTKTGTAHTRMIEELYVVRPDILQHRNNVIHATETNETQDNSTETNSTQWTSPWNSTLLKDQNFTLIELIKYHIVNNTFDLSEIPVQDNLTYVANSMVTNETVNKFENGLPLVIDSNTTIINNTLWNTTSSSSTTPSNTHISVASSGGQSFYNVTDYNSTFVTVLNNTSSGNKTANSTYTIPVGYRVGNGEVTANVLLRDIIASNGRLNIIDKVLVPPVSPTNVIDNVTSTSDFKKLFLQYPQIAAQLNSTNNFTLFAPTDKALNGFDYKKYDNQTLMNLMQTHVLEGLYYTTNFTEATSGNGTAQVSAMNGAQFPVTVSNNGSVITLNNTAHIVKSNVLFNNGVMHLIDQVLQPQAQTNQTQATQPSQNAQSSQNVQPTQSNGNVQPSQTDVVPSNTADPNQPMQPSQSNQDDQPSQPNPETPLPQT
ncbi:secreted cell-adhesion lipo protein [Phycomyces blakesleeanus NRRL 1555(-)]|uniref:Secreted cell-adhesion lipo protein n=1 Tax=Phycomyces blakesleeanus (strain ATCC 8743b / DSM 1359 / FGSC 10004 / NBRC 33097 / NRRL 1555) TaxID=763407 RepID=A0A162UZ44_PHYB8|nr:secreted cell-adhesion lipo protein [Phycomyces blakesleeanus NRRL 1555(-)]OAD78922.1 secreted cell-adhesion lipo protein [Phycomyces blakesleeanus NRRL 1555(-)]|eukprot:XP_018296962.1 secreted cell-adhesion lipo protein [Phycomyces blakesleeanus NRRL 1555(-)]